MNNPFLAILAGLIVGGGFSLAFIDALASDPLQHSGTQSVTVHSLRSW